MTKTKILIAGIGGVGGYFGGLLAKHYFANTNVEIFFLTRGEHLSEIRTRGLIVRKGDIEFIAKPKLATDNPVEIGIVDFIIICTKNFDLEQTIQQLFPCINTDTIILPLLNGVDSKERIQNILPGNIILDGCAYIVSRLTDDGEIKNSGNIEKLFFGLDHFENERILFLESVFKEAEIEATFSKDISSIIWEKFIFISPVATATSYFNNNKGTLLADNGKFDLLKTLIEEVKQLAKTKKIKVSDDITEKILNILMALPFTFTLKIGMHRGGCSKW